MIHSSFYSHGALARSGISRKSARKNAVDHEIEAAKFAIISDWCHYAILEMTFKKGFKLEAKWISNRLGISPIEAKIAVRNLIMLGLLEKEGSRWKKAHLSIDTRDQTKTSIFHRKRIRQVLEKSIHSLENDSIEGRNHTAITLCVDPSRIPEAKIRIREFLWELTRFLEGENPSRTSELVLSLFSLEKNHEK